MNHLEDRIQADIVSYLRLNRILVFAVPNGGARNAITGALLKKQERWQVLVT